MPPMDLATRLWRVSTVGQIRDLLAAAGVDPHTPAERPAPDNATAARPYPIPGPYEIALTVGAALASTGLYATPGAALAAAWAAVPEFYLGRDMYLNEIVPALQGLAGAINGAGEHEDASDFAG